MFWGDGYETLVRLTGFRACQKPDVMGGLTLELQAKAGRVARVALLAHTPCRPSPLSTPTGVRPKPWGLSDLPPPYPDTQCAGRCRPALCGRCHARRPDLRSTVGIGHGAAAHLKRGYHDSGTELSIGSSFTNFKLNRPCWPAQVEDTSPHCFPAPRPALLCSYSRQAFQPVCTTYSRPAPPENGTHSLPSLQAHHGLPMDLPVLSHPGLCGTVPPRVSHSLLSSCMTLNLLRTSKSTHLPHLKVSSGTMRTEAAFLAHSSAQKSSRHLRPEPAHRCPARDGAHSSQRPHRAHWAGTRTQTGRPQRSQQTGLRSSARRQGRTSPPQCSPTRTPHGSALDRTPRLPQGRGSPPTVSSCRDQ